MRRLVACERRATVALIASLAEFDARRLYVAAGFSSLFTYCTQQLRLGEGAAYRRIEAARTCRRFPAAIGMLADGALTLTTLTILAPCLTDANHVDVLARAVHKSKRKVEMIAAELHQRPDVAATLRRLPRPRPRAATQAAAFAVASEALPSAPDPAASLSPAPLSAAPESSVPFPPAPRPVVAPLAPERFRLQVTMSRDTHDTLREIQDLIRHTVPSGDLEVILARAFVLLRDHLLRHKAATVNRPRPVPVPTGKSSRYIPAGVRRSVWARDGAQCAFKGPAGRCEERRFLEFHHVKPSAAGGASDEHNIELRCRVHNGYEAELFFGRRHQAEATGADRADTG
ncbi:MAG: hypothetical protein M3Q55_01070 [Acidobacteriota bacterium]|nr:hypothetical protein [Acidobacteriota bacterium]